MSTKKLTPLEVLKKQEARLKIGVSALTEVVHEDCRYLYSHIGPLLGDSALDAVSSKMPPIVQSLMNRRQPWQEQPEPQSPLTLLAAGALEIAPFLLGFGKGKVARFALGLLAKRILKKK
ncbi:MAG: hypothetical protein LBN93_10370 [Candidatus Symbiothrix sp.]|jgi:hypothetical protein|nr:hypothetical protein [Candidatus Symbiothrix sp.]